MRFSPGSCSCGTLFDIAAKKEQLEQLNSRMGQDGFWDNPERAQQVIAQTKPLNAVLKPFNELFNSSEDLRVLCELSEEDDSLEAEVEPALVKLEQQIADFEMRSMLDGAQDASNAYLRIQAGT